MYIGKNSRWTNRGKKEYARKLLARGADTRHIGDGYVMVDGELSSQKVPIFFHPVDPGRSFLESSILPLYVYLLPLYVYLLR
jgi:hypothetical protein